MKKAGLVLTLLMLLSWGWKSVVLNGIYKAEQGQYGKLNEIFRGTNQYDVLFIGNSRIERQIQTDSLDFVSPNNEPLSAYNAGLMSCNGGIPLAILEHFISSGRTPKVLVVSFDFTTWTQPFMVEQLNDSKRYWPYLHIEPLKREVCAVAPQAYAMHYLPPYFITAFDDDFYRSSYEGYSGNYSFADSNNFLNGGYRPPPNLQRIDFNRLRSKTHIGPINKREIAIVERIVDCCKENNIQLIALNPPIYEGSMDFYRNNNPCWIMFQKLAKKHQLRVIEMSDTPLSKDKSLFLDELHLTREGVNQFNKMLSDSLRQLIF